MSSENFHRFPLCVSRSSIDLSLLDEEEEGYAIPEAKEFMVPTLNRHGFMFAKFDPLVERLLLSIEQNPDQAVFEVGGAYGNVAEAALKRGIKEYYLNDFEMRHLLAFARKMKRSGEDSFLSSIRLILGRCPEDVFLQEGAFDAILLNKVLHFFTPDTIDEFVRWVRKGLKIGGRVFVFNVSPFLAWDAPLLGDYYKKQKQGVRFPGYCSHYGESIAALKYEESVRPHHILFMEIETLKDLFQEHGFSIEEQFQLSYNSDLDSSWIPGNEMVGVIAVKTSE